MSFGKEKRLLLAMLALVAPLPLPFNDVLEWPVLLAFALVVALLVRRAARGSESWLPGWAMNLLGLAYLPVLYVDLVVRWSGQLVRPVIHLALFAVGVKLFSLRQERDAWHVMIGAFFLFLAAMGTSVHPSIMLYLVAFVAVSLTVLARFAYFSVLARFGYRREEPVRTPLRAFVLGATAAAILMGAPLFALLPRIRTPYLVVRGAGTGTIVHAAGFSDLITLDSIGSTRTGRQVLMRMRFSPQPEPRREIRVKAETYDAYDGRTWRANGNSQPIAPEQGGTFRLAKGRPTQQAEIWLLPWNNPSLPMPVQAVGLLFRAPAIARDKGGAVSLYYIPGSTLRYDVELGDQPGLDQLPAPDVDGGKESSLDVRGVTPRVAALAQQLMGEGTPFERARHLEDRLSHDYTYTTEFVGRSGQLALEDFLFRTKRGHCEFFATAMVVMLRSQGIPARFVTGFLGGEPSAFEGYYVIRQSNAHAWVEAWMPDGGWQVFDPTPASGRPGAVERNLPMLFSEAWDYVQFRWDRYVLTYGFYDQMSLLLSARSAWLSFWRLFQRNEHAPDVAAAIAKAVPAPPVEMLQEGGAWRRWRFAAGIAILAVFVATIAVLMWRQSRQRRTATESYRRLREKLERGGMQVPESLAPLRLAEAARDRFPSAAEPTGRLVGLYLRESFAEETLSEPEVLAAYEALREVESVLAKAG